MSKVCIYIKLAPYLEQWVRWRMGATDGTPLRMPRGSVESSIIKLSIMRRPPHVSPLPLPEETVAIEIPDSRERPPEHYNYLPARAVRELVVTLRERFDLDMWQALHKFKYIGRRRQDIIWDYLESRGMEMTEANWAAVAKRYQRKRKSYLRYERTSKPFSPRQAGRRE